MNGSWLRERRAAIRQSPVFSRVMERLDVGVGVPYKMEVFSSAYLCSLVDESRFDVQLEMVDDIRCGKSWMPQDIVRGRLLDFVINNGI